MPLSRSSFQTLARRASSLSDRIRCADAFADVAPTDAAEARLLRWSRALGGDARLEKRLCFAGLDRNAALRLLVDTPPDRFVCDWFRPFAQFLADLDDELRGPELALPASGHAPIAFEEALEPFVQLGRRSLFAALRLAALPAHVSAQAYAQLERALREQLSLLASRTLFSAFCEARPPALAFLALAEPSLAGPAPRTHYERFVAGLNAERWAEIFERSPVLARLLWTQVSFWADSTAEFLRRLAEDRAALGDCFGAPADCLGSVIADVSDAHHGGRHVILCRFESGLAVAYKPRSCSLDSRYRRVVSELFADADAKLELHTPKALPRPEHGWLELIEHAPIVQEGGAERFYHRAGALVYLWYLLGGSDCHYQNVIARGEHPIVIDLETLLQHHVRPQPEGPFGTLAEKQAEALLFDSVLGSSLLPIWKYDSTLDTAYDVSALGAQSEEKVRATRWVWADPNTDRMIPQRRMLEIGAVQHCPRVGRQLARAADHVEAIVAGFGAAYAAASKRPLLEKGAALDAFRTERVRFVLRDTRIYSALLLSGMSPERLGAGVERSLCFEGLAGRFLNCDEPPPDWAIFTSELRSLEQLDVPHFTARVDSTDLVTDEGEHVSNFFPLSSYARLEARVARSSPEDCRRQASILRAAFDAREAMTGPERSSTIRPERGRELNREECLSEALRLGRELEERALDFEGKVTWLGLAYEPSSLLLRFAVLRPDLYDGSLGVATFLAALARVSGDARFGELARRALSTVLRFTGDPDMHAGEEAMILGATHGVGAVVFTLQRIANLLDAPDLHVQAERAARFVRPFDIEADQYHDVMYGASGLGLALLSLGDEGEWISLARRCADHLLRAQTARGGWPSPHFGRPLTGFSHGASGIGLFLIRLGQCCGDSRYTAAGRAAFDYERSVYDCVRRNWPDLRGESLDFKTSWCHGAPGIALSRLAAASTLDDPTAERELATALETTRAYPVVDLDNVCCGNFGRLEVLNQAAQVQGSPRLQSFCLARAAELLDRAREFGGYRVFESIRRPVVNPGFFQGTAGIGYTLLRLIDPSLPSVLAFEGC